MPAPFLKMIPERKEEVQTVETKKAEIIKIHKKYWKCMNCSVIMSLSCIARSIVNYNYSEDSRAKRG